jgi:NADH-quinone oxidoreductase subunit B
VSGVTADLAGAALQPARHLLDDGRRFALWVFDVGLACCAVEVLAASLGRGDDGVARLGALPVDGDPATADVLVVSGTVTDKIAPSVRALYERLPEPRYVVSFGACANSGGPYWDSYSVTKGVHEILPVDVYVPGCPPRPQALLDALRSLP